MIQTIEVNCRVCGKLLRVECGDGFEKADQETLDYFARSVTCNACMIRLGRLKPEQLRESVQSKLPYKDE